MLKSWFTEKSFYFLIINRVIGVKDLDDLLEIELKIVIHTLVDHWWSFQN